MSPRVILYILYMVCFLSCSHLWHFHFLLISVGYDLNLMIKASTCLYTPTINANSRNWSLMISRKESPCTGRKILKISNCLNWRTENDVSITVWMAVLITEIEYLRTVWDCFKFSSSVWESRRQAAWNFGHLFRYKRGRICRVMSFYWFQETIND